jgi:hypothetical protein
LLLCFPIEKVHRINGWSEIQGSRMQVRPDEIERISTGICRVTNNNDVDCDEADGWDGLVINVRERERNVGGIR